MENTSLEGRDDTQAIALVKLKGITLYSLPLLIGHHRALEIVKYEKVIL